MIKLKTMTKIKMAAQNIFTVSPLSALNYVRYKLFKRGPEMNLSAFRPILGALLVTRRCNLNCPFCIVPPLSRPKEWQAYEADLEKVGRILDHPAVQRALYIGLSGGEPLLNKSLPNIVRLIRSRGHLCGVVTNGILLGQYVEELKKSGVNIINISIYDYNIEQLAAVLPEANRVFPCRTNKILRRSELEQNPAKIEDAIRLSRDSGCYGMYLGNYLPQVSEDTVEVIFEDNVKYSEFRAAMASKYRGFQIYWPTPMKRTLMPNDKMCRMLWYYISIDMMGNMGLCCNYSTNQNGEYGNLFTSDATGVLNLPLKVEMRKILLGEDSNIPVHCRNCPIMCDQWVSDY